MKTIFCFLLLFMYSIAYSQADLGKGLMAYYPFNGNAKDMSGNNNDPAFNNAVLTTDHLGHPGSAYHFNGSNNYMKVPNSPSLNMKNQMSIAAWVRPTGWYTGPCYNNMLLMKGDEDYYPGNYSLRFSDVYTGCTSPTTTEERFNSFDAAASGSPILQLNKWYSVVCTYDGKMIRTYVNCIARDSVLTRISSFKNFHDLYIGRMNNDQYPFWLNGDLDEVRIYNRVLNEDEVKEYGECKAPEMSLLFSNPLVIKNKLIKLKWSTNAETNIHDYFVERSTKKNSNKFTSLGNVASNKKSTSNKYTFTDSTAKPNTLYYYRIVINDNNSKTKYTETKTAKIIDKQLLATTLLNTNDINELQADSVRAAALFALEQYNEQHKDSLNDIPGPVTTTAAAKVSERRNDIQETIYFSADSLELTLYDNAEIDGDTVSVLMNGDIIIAKQLLSATGFIKKIAMPQNTDSIQLIMYAENLGSIPPNTGLLIVRDGRNKHEVHFSGDMRKNATIILKKVTSH
ncbi:MAG: LamG domain-containing protein [Ferruginibacter sp.]